MSCGGSGEIMPFVRKVKNAGAGSGGYSSEKQKQHEVETVAELKAACKLSRIHILTAPVQRHPLLRSYNTTNQRHSVYAP